MQRSTSSAIFQRGGLPVAGLMATGAPGEVESGLGLSAMAASTENRHTCRRISGSGAANTNHIARIEAAGNRHQNFPYGVNRANAWLLQFWDKSRGVSSKASRVHTASAKHVLL